MKELRKKLREIRRSIDQPSRKKKGKQLLYQCQKNAIFRNAKHVAIFIPNDGEIETENTINFLIHQGYFVYLPILVGEKLKFAKIGKLFKKNRFGIEEPLFTPLLGAHRMDLILMPLVGFDKQKNRLGMGGGFYDKTLSFHRKLKGFRVPKLFGLAFDVQEVSRLESQPWDVPVDGIVTPTRFIN
jgi:5-formyltetrahydrofolate cyclo-ligase